MRIFAAACVNTVCTGCRPPADRLCVTDHRRATSRFTVEVKNLAVSMWSKLVSVLPRPALTRYSPVCCTNTDRSLPKQVRGGHDPRPAPPPLCSCPGACARVGLRHTSERLPKDTQPVKSYNFCRSLQSAPCVLQFTCTRTRVPCVMNECIAICVFLLRVPA